MEQANRKHESGQSLVEMALTLPIIVLILAGLIDIGRVYYTYVALEEAAAEGALYLSLNPDCIYASDGSACANPNNVEWRILNTASNQEIDPEHLTITNIFRDPNYGVGDEVRVTVSYRFLFITPGIRAIADGVSGGEGLELGVTASNIILIEND